MSSFEPPNPFLPLLACGHIQPYYLSCSHPYVPTSSCPNPTTTHYPQPGFCRACVYRQTLSAAAALDTYYATQINAVRARVNVLRRLGEEWDAYACDMERGTRCGGWLDEERWLERAVEKGEGHERRLLRRWRAAVLGVWEGFWDVWGREEGEGADIFE